MHVSVVMPDHVHLVFAPFQDVPLSKIMQGIKGSSARAVNRLLSRPGPLWQEESWDRVIRLRDGLQQAAAYVAENPIRSGLVGPEEEYPWLWRGWVEGASADG
jgi:putative transposase